MLKLAACTFDVYDDTNGAIARSLPDHLHSELKVAELDVVAQLPDSAFGLVLKTASGAMLRRFPLHDAEAQKTSRAYWDRTKGNLPAEAQAVVEAKFANPASHKVAFVDSAKFAHAAAPAWDDKAWGLTIAGKDMFPLHDAELVKMAMTRYPATTENLAPEHKFAYARNIVKRAAALGVEIPSDSPINRYTNGVVNLQALDHAIVRRKTASPNLGKDILDQLSTAAGCALVRGDDENNDSWNLRQAKRASATRLDAAHIVAVLQAFDKLAGYTARDYARHVPDPFASVFAKSAAPQGIFVDGVNLSAIRPDALTQHFDEGFVKEFLENPAQVYSSSPDPVKRLIRAQAEKDGNLPPERPAQAYEPSGHGDPMPVLNPVYTNGSAATGS